MPSYLIFRHGSNAANQSMTPVEAVAIVEAASPDSAKAIAADNVTVYANQYLEAVAESDLNAAQLKDWNYIVSRSAEMQAYLGESLIFSE